MAASENDRRIDHVEFAVADLARALIEAAGGKIVKPAYDFPGGRRFHFADPDGYELAVWTKAEPRPSFRGGAPASSPEPMNTAFSKNARRWPRLMRHDLCSWVPGLQLRCAPE